MFVLFEGVRWCLGPCEAFPSSGHSRVLLVLCIRSFVRGLAGEVTLVNHTYSQAAMEHLWKMQLTCDSGPAAG